jgi:hypothetical protein
MPSVQSRFYEILIRGAGWKGAWNHIEERAERGRLPWHVASALPPQSLRRRYDFSTSDVQGRKVYTVCPCRPSAKMGHF